MTIEDKLQSFILKRYKSIMQFAKIADVPYTTVKGIFSRGIWGASVQNITKICDVLAIDVDELIRGNIAPKQKAITLTKHETDVVEAYRNKPEMQPAVDKLLGLEDDFVALPMAARSETNRPVGLDYISKEKLEQLRNDKSVADEVDL